MLYVVPEIHNTVLCISGGTFIISLHYGTVHYKEPLKSFDKICLIKLFIHLVSLGAFMLVIWAHLVVAECKKRINMYIIHENNNTWYNHLCKTYHIKNKIQSPV